jgi:Carbon-nitrogen hydrolase
VSRRSRTGTGACAWSAPGSSQTRPAARAEGGAMLSEDEPSARSGARTVRATVVQAASAAFDRERSLDRVAELTAQAATDGAELVVFPEAFVGGYPKGADFGARVGTRSTEGREWFRRYHEGAMDVPGPAVERLGEVARASGVHLVVGVIEREGGTLYCTVLFVGHRDVVDEPDRVRVGPHRRRRSGYRTRWRGHGLHGSRPARREVREHGVPLSAAVVYWLAPPGSERADVGEEPRLPGVDGRGPAPPGRQR